ncbi:hypothetical protein ABT247_11315 [Kitasatospora sp. NPDC001539]|uniref:hypothetical protein n=1 Tax=Kitasatospora sp. NPDC001539 TaxID=3154384 RepID=UPI00332A2F54
MAERRHEYAPAGTLPGLLQRGRGLGARMAAEDPSSAAELVYGCIRWEWRWDPRADARDLYLARLLRDLELPLGPVTAMRAAGGAPGERAARVLDLLERGGPAGRAEAAGPAVAAGPAPDHGAPPPDAPPDAPPDVPAPDAPPDVPALIAELEQRWVDRSWCGPVHLARRLARSGPRAAGAASLLRRFWLWTPHSSERPGYLEALAAIGSAGLADAYTESLWDCEPGARLSGIEHAPERPEVGARLVVLRDDPMEETAVREAAAVRLARGRAG